MLKMKDSGVKWIKSIPLHWGILPLKYNYDIVSGSTPDSTNSQFWDGNITWITPADYKTNDVYVSCGSRTITELGFKSCSTMMIPEGSIIFSKRAPIGTVAINSTTLCTNQGCLGLIRKNQSVDNKYYYYVLSIYSDVFNLYGSGTTFKEISATVFGNVMMPLAPITEQVKIVNYLDKKCAEIDALTADIQAEIDTLEEYKKSVITEAVTKGLDPNVEMKKSKNRWVKFVPNEWCETRFKYIAIIKSNLVNPALYGAYHQIAPDLIEKDSGKILGERTVEEVGVDSWNHLFRSGQILYSKIRPVLNKVVIAPYDGLCSADMYPIETKYDTRYLWYSMLSDYFVAQVNQVTRDRVKMPKINQDELGNIQMVIAPIDLQHQIADYLDAKCFEIDAILAEKRMQISIITNYKKSLIYEYVTGKKEVPSNDK